MKRHQKFLIAAALVFWLLFITCKTQAANCEGQLNMYAVSVRLLDNQMQHSDIASLRLQKVMKTRLLKMMQKVCK